MTMLHPRHNRIDYGAALSAPADFHFDQAIATTFSLDLQTLVAVPLALHYGQNLDADFSEIPCELLDAVRRSTKNIRIFHQHGRIKVPGNYNRLLALFDNSLIAVHPDGPFQSFHPKIWLLRFRSDANKLKYRLIVTSRNLTESRDWDAAVWLDGEPGIAEAEQTDINAGLSEMCRELLSYCDGADAIVQGLQAAIPKLTWTLPENCVNAAFHWSNQQQAVVPLAGRKGQNLLCISPFVDSKTLQQLAAMANGKRWLLGRADELNQLTSDYDPRDHFDTRVLSDLVESEIGADDDPAFQSRAASIHAKCYVLDQGQHSSLVLGSSNATQAARFGNTEAFVELRFRRKHFSSGQYAEQLFASEDLGALFNEWQPLPASSSDRASEQALQRFVHSLLSAPLQASVSTESESETWALELNLDLRQLKPTDDIVLQVAPAGREATMQTLKPGAANRLLFRGIKSADLSRYIAFKVCSGTLFEKRFLITAEVTGIPEERDSHIVRSLFDSEEKFLRYCRFLLLSNEEKTLPASMSHSNSAAGPSSVHALLTAGMFEELLTNASRHPERLRDLHTLVTQLVEDPESKAVIPPRFLELWEQFSTWSPPAPAESAT